MNTEKTELKLAAIQAFEQKLPGEDIANAAVTRRGDVVTATYPSGWVLEFSDVHTSRSFRIARIIGRPSDQPTEDEHLEALEA